VQYHRSPDRYYAQLTHHRGHATERDAEHDDLVSLNWLAVSSRQRKSFRQIAR
jgi:hypothetical protein